MLSRWTRRVQAEVLKEKLEKSLRELGTDFLDIYYLHELDRTTPYAETFYGLDNLYRAEKFKLFSLNSFLAVEVAGIMT